MSQISQVSVITTGMIVSCTLAATAAPVASRPADIKMHRQEVTDSQVRYIVRMGGTMDGLNTRGPVGYRVFDQAFEPNVELSITNLGDDIVHNPWITIDGRGPWRSVQEIATEFTAGLTTEVDKARAAYEFQRKRRFHCSTYDGEVRDIVKMLNGYGYSLCFDDSKCLAQLWQAAGLKTRRGWPYGHSVTEVFYDDAWHMLDGDEHGIYLLRDNKTIAGEEQFVRDPGLIKRTHSYGPLARDSRSTDEGGAALFYYDGPRGGTWRETSKHTMDYDLRPGEKIAWRWEYAGRYHGYEKLDMWTNATTRVCNGYMEYVSDLKTEAQRKGIVTAQMDLSSGCRQIVTIPAKSAWPIVGGWVEVTANDTSRLEEVQILKTGMAEPKSIWTSEGKTVEATARVNLDGEFPAASPACYQYSAILVVYRAKTPGCCPTPPDPVQSVKLHSTLQMAWLAMPALACGDNTVSYSDGSKSRNVSIVHQWAERSDAAPPPAPPSAIFPKDGATAAGTKFKFEWEAPKAEGKIVDYWFELSDRQDMRWPLSPNFERLISLTKNSGAASFDTPYEGLLNPGQAYYWRVRARNDAGIWGPWSKTWSFTPKAPAPPLAVRMDWDKDSRVLALSWQANPHGDKPAKYILYGSDEKGFTASDEPHPVNCGASGTRTFPANRVAETAEPRYVIRMADPVMVPPAATQATASRSAALQPVLERATNPGPVRMFYRIVAVSEDGTRSGPSDYAQVPGPIIYTTAPKEVPASQTTLVQMRAAASAGNLRSRAHDEKSYQADFGLNADELRWSVHSDVHVEIDPMTGLLRLMPAIWDCWTPAEVIVICRNQQGQEDAYRFQIEVTPPATADKVTR